MVSSTSWLAPHARFWLRSGRNVATGTRIDWQASHAGQVGRKSVCPNRRQPDSSRPWYSTAESSPTYSYPVFATRSGKYEQGCGGVVKVTRETIPRHSTNSTAVGDGITRAL